LNFIVLVVILSLIEIIFRVIFYAKYHQYHTSVSVQGNTLQAADDVLVYRNRAYYLDQDKKHQFNEEGFKSNAGDTEMPVKSPGDFWVFLFGASAMEGMGSNKDGEWLDITGILDYSYKESIVFQLQQQLQAMMPGRKVKVFCAANSGFSIYQSMLRYEQLKAKYKMDWVISMDGNNEPLLGNTNLSIRDYIVNDWKEYPIFKFPLKYIIPITKRSASVNALKRFLFERRMNKRIKNAVDDNFPARAKWLAANPGQLTYAHQSGIVQRSVDSFFYYMKRFDQELTSDNIPHLLFVQPHLTMRDTIKMSPTEKALLHYYIFSRNREDINSFIAKIEEEAAKQDLNAAIQSLAFMHGNDFETFVDYCHFSQPAIRQLSGFFAERIAAQYKSVQK
jgi:hypothetical protein